MENKPRLTAWHGLGATVFALLFMLFGSGVMHRLFGNVGGMLSGTVLALIALAFVLATRTKRSEVFPLELPPMRQFFASLGIFLGVLFLNGVIGVALAQVIPNYAAREEGIDAMVTSMSPLTAILIVALQPAVCEEFFCRGFLAASFRELKSEGAVIFLTSLIFGFLHMDLYAFLPAAILGAAFAFIALRTRSLLIPMILHFLNNAFSVVVAYVTVGSDANASSFADLSTATLLSYIAFYLGLAIFFLWFSLRWFLGKKLIVKSSLLPFILASAFVVVGYGGLLATSLDFVVNETQTVAYTEVIAQEIPVTLEEGGNYAMEVTAFADHPFRIVLKRGNEIVKSTTYDTAPSLSFSGSLEAGNYSVGFYSADGAEITEGRLTYVIMAVLSKL